MWPDCSADLQIAHGDLEAGAELRVFADGVEPLLRDLRQDLALAEGQVGIRVAAGAAHAAADLVQLGEAEAVGVLDDEGVDVRDVDAGLDDGGADEDLDLTVRHRLHDVAELLLIHLAVGDGMRCLIFAAHWSIDSTRLCR